MTAYVALIRKDESSDYGVDFPDFPGCVTAGRTPEEAVSMAAEALALHVQGMLEDDQTLPGPTSLADVMRSPENRSAQPVLVQAPARSEHAKA